MLGVTIAKTEYIKDKFTTGLNLTSKKKDVLNYDVYSFIEIVGNHFSLKPFIKNRIVWILKNLFGDYHTLINQVGYENAVLGVMVFVLKESDLPCYSEVDVSYFVNCLYKKEDCKKNTIQIYQVAQVAKDLFSEIDPGISQVDEVKKNNYN